MTAQDQNRAKLSRLEDTLFNLGSQLLFADELDRISRRESRLEETSVSLAKLRSRGYRFAAPLESMLEAARAAAPQAVEGTRAESEKAGRNLRPQLDRAKRDLRLLSQAEILVEQEPRLARIEREIEALEEAAGAARKRIEAINLPFTKPYDEVEKRLRSLHKMLDRFDERSFDMTPEENALAAFEATWQDAPDGVEMEGLLLLSDHRIRFEQREEKVTKRKFLVFAAEKETIQKCWIDEPIGHIESSTDETKGFVLKDQLLILKWARAAKAHGTTTFELDGISAKEADEQIEAILSGEIERDRVPTDSSEPHEPPPDWPEECSDCGADMAPPVKGQTRIRCTYCGHTYQL